MTKGMKFEQLVSVLAETGENQEARNLSREADFVETILAVEEGVFAQFIAFLGENFSTCKVEEWRDKPRAQCVMNGGAWPGNPTKGYQFRLASAWEEFLETIPAE